MMFEAINERKTSRQGPLWSGFAPVAFTVRNRLDIVSNGIVTALVLLIWWVERQTAKKTY